MENPNDITRLKKQNESHNTKMAANNSGFKVQNISYTVMLKWKE